MKNQNNAKYSLIGINKEKGFRIGSGIDDYTGQKVYMLEKWIPARYQYGRYWDGYWQFIDFIETEEKVYKKIKKLGLKKRTDLLLSEIMELTRYDIYDEEPEDMYYPGRILINWIKNFFKRK